jgi:hypothetical protein
MQIFWTNQIPREEVCDLPLPFPVENTYIEGAKRSGKTTALKEILSHKKPEEKCLVLTNNPYAISDWEPQKNTVIHTADSLAFHIFQTYKKNKEPLIWTTEKNIAFPFQIHEAIPQDQVPSEYAKALLAQNRMTPGIAHWLLKTEIAELLTHNVIPKPDLLLVEEPEEWDAEAWEWCKKIPSKNKVITTKELKKRSIKLKGWYPHNSAKKQKFKSVTPEESKLPTGEWLLKNLDEETAIVIQTNKKDWETYLYNRTALRPPILHATELNGLKFERILIPDLKENWGNKQNAMRWLDLCHAQTPELKIRSSLHSFLPPKTGKHLVWSC